MQCDYKISAVTWDGSKTSFTARFYSGETKILSEIVIGRESKNISRYRRENLMSQEKFSIDGKLSDDDMAQIAGQYLKKISEAKGHTMIPSQRFSLKENAQPV